MENQTNEKNNESQPFKLTQMTNNKDNKQNAVEDDKNENLIREVKKKQTQHKEQQKQYGQEGFSYSSNTYLKKFANSSLEQYPQILADLPLRHMLRSLAKIFLLNEMEILFVCYYLEINHWNIQNHLVQQNAEKVKDYLEQIKKKRVPEDPEILNRYYKVSLFLALIAYYVKVYLNSKDSTELIDQYITLYCDNFLQIFSQWCKGGNDPQGNKQQNNLKIDPKKLNKVFKSLTNKITQNIQNVENQDYNELVDNIIQISPPYNNSQIAEHGSHATNSTYNYQGSQQNNKSNKRQNNISQFQKNNKFGEKPQKKVQKEQINSMNLNEFSNSPKNNLETKQIDNLQNQNSFINSFIQNQFLRQFSHQDIDFGQINSMMVQGNNNNNDDQLPSFFHMQQQNQKFISNSNEDEKDKQFQQNDDSSKLKLEPQTSFGFFSGFYKPNANTNNNNQIQSNLNPTNSFFDQGSSILQYQNQNNNPNQSNEQNNFSINNNTNNINQFPILTNKKTVSFVSTKKNNSSHNLQAINSLNATNQYQNQDEEENNTANKSNNHNNNNNNINNNNNNNNSNDKNNKNENNNNNDENENENQNPTFNNDNNDQGINNSNDKGNQNNSMIKSQNNRIIQEIKQEQFQSPKINKFIKEENKEKQQKDADNAEDEELEQNQPQLKSMISDTLFLS